MIRNNFYENNTRSVLPSEQEKFVKFQCRARQMIMRDNFGKPDDSIMPNLYLDKQKEPICKIITLIHKLPEFSLLTELKHIAKKTNDPSQIREQAIRLLSSSYYQKNKEFSDILTATFTPESEIAKTLIEKGVCRLLFEAFSHRFDVKFNVIQLEKSEFLYHSTISHNQLFNINIHPETIVLSFCPKWNDF